MRAPLRTFVTGFHGFGGFAVNPSALLAESCGRPFEPALARLLDAIETSAASA